MRPNEYWIDCAFSTKASHSVPFPCRATCCHSPMHPSQKACRLLSPFPLRQSAHKALTRSRLIQWKTLFKLSRQPRNAIMRRRRQLSYLRQNAKANRGLIRSRLIQWKILFKPSRQPRNATMRRHRRVNCRQLRASMNRGLIPKLFLPLKILSKRLKKLNRNWFRLNHHNPPLNLSRLRLHPCARFLAQKSCRHALPLRPSTAR